jgi:stringent starvation protein B
MGSPDRPSKHEAFLALLREGWTSLHLDARRGGVVVPAHLKGEGHLVLQYGNDLPIRIPDLHVDEYGVTATLSFARSLHQTVVPWSAVYVVASEDGRGVLYHEDIPQDVSVIAARGETDAADGATESLHDGLTDGLNGAADEPDIAPRPTPTRALRAVPLGGALEEARIDLLDDARPEVMPVRRRRRPQLRLVK